VWVGINIYTTPYVRTSRILVCTTPPSLHDGFCSYLLYMRYRTWQRAVYGGHPYISSFIMVACQGNILESTKGIK